MTALQAFRTGMDRIPQSQLNIATRTRTNPFPWNGQFSPQFAEAILSKYCAPGMRIFDPFLGSGTVLCEAARLGVYASGVELNPSAYYMSKAYELCGLTGKERKELLAKFNDAVMLARYSDAFQTGLREAYCRSEEPLRSVLALYLILLDPCGNEADGKRTDAKWKLLNDIITKLPYSEAPIRAYLADARSTPLSDKTVDFVLTSPPYINVFNYHQKYRQAVEDMGYDVLKIAKAEIGANRKFRANRLLTVVQYCIDMAFVVKELSRICADDAAVVFVVGRESSVLGYPFCNSDLTHAIFCDIFNWNLAFRQERFFTNRYGQLIYEDILYFNKSALTVVPSDSAITDQARGVAAAALTRSTAMDNKPENRALLLKAIQNVSFVQKSEENH